MRVMPSQRGESQWWLWLASCWFMIFSIFLRSHSLDGGFKSHTRLGSPKRTSKRLGRKYEPTAIALENLSKYEDGREVSWS